MRLLIAAALFVLAYIYFNHRRAQEQESIPPYVLETLSYIKQHKRAPEGYVGGRVFRNREKRLPIYSGSKRISYKEWDVHPKVKGKNRGAERLVTGSDRSAYYTRDHYQSFIQLE